MTAKAAALHLGKLLADRATVRASGRYVRVQSVDAPAGAFPETLTAAEAHRRVIALRRARQEAGRG